MQMMRETTQDCVGLDPSEGAAMLSPGAWHLIRD